MLDFGFERITDRVAILFLDEPVIVPVPHGSLFRRERVFQDFAHTQEKIDIVKSRLIKNYGYDEESANDVLNFVASIFARGDAES